MPNRIKADPQKWLARLLPGGIRERLFLLIAVAVLPLLILLLWVYEQRYESRRTQEVQTEVEVARGVAASFAAYVQGINQQNYAIGESILTDRSYNPEDVTLLLTRTAAHFPALRNMNWVRPGGIVQASSLPDLVGRDLSVRPYFQQVLSGQPWAIGDITQTGAVTPAPTLAIATGLRDDHNTLLGVVVAAIEPTRLGELVLSQERPAGGEYSIFDRQGVLIYNSSLGPLRWEDRVHWKEKDPLLQDVLQSGKERMGITSLPLPGENWIAARVPVSGTGFIAGAGRPLKDAIGPIQSDSMRDALIASTVGLLAFLLATLIARTISNPLHRLEQDAEQMGAGKLEKAEDPQAPNEVRCLRNTVEIMAADLRLQAVTAHENEERYKVLFQNRHTPMLVIDPETGGIVDANPAASSFYGWDRDELVQRKITDINAFTPDQTRQEIVRAAASLSSQQFFFRHRLSNGDLREVEVHSGPIEIKGRTYLFSIIHDVTDRKRLETEREQLIAQLDQERARWQGVVEGIADEVWTCDAQGNMSLMNLPAEPAMGLDEFKDLPYEKVLEEVDILYPNGEVRPVEQAPLLRSLRGEIVRGEEIMRHRQNGKTRYRQYSSAPMRDATGRITGSVAIVRDVTDYKELEESLRQNEAQLRAIFEAMSDAVVVFDRDGKVTQANLAAKATYGFDPADSQQWAEAYQSLPVTHLDGTPIGTEDLISTRVMRGEKLVGEPFLYSNLSGRQATILASASPLLNQDLEFQGAVIVWHDITELEQVQRDLAVSRQRLEDTLESIQDGFMELDRDWRFTYLNERAAQNLGNEPGQLIGKIIWEVYPTLVGTELAAFYRRVMDQRQPDKLETQGFLSETWYEVRAYPSIEGITIFWTDISGRKQTEQALRLSETRLRQLFDTSVIGIMTRDGQGTIIDANEALLSMLGYSRADLEAGTLHIEQLLPEEYQPVEEQITREVLTEGVSKPHEKELTRKDGAHVPVLVGYTRLDGAQIEVVGFVIDLTELKEAQAALEDYAERLKRSNQDLEQFAFVASHDLQEPLRKVKFFGDRIVQKAGQALDEEARDSLERMQNAAGRMQEMIRALLELSRVSTQGKAFQEVNLSQVAEEVIGDLEGRIRKENGQVFVGPLPVIEADPTQMQRLLQNLIGNALKYHKGDLPPVVTITGKVHSGKNSQGAVLTLTVEDNGIGFEEQYAERIFQPFQRLHGRGTYEGTGMGLAICQKIVDRHSGKISAQSKPGEGSIFMVKLPVRQPAGAFIGN
jgi:PAS domain S-box-containing protein